MALKYSRALFCLINSTQILNLGLHMRPSAFFSLSSTLFPLNILHFCQNLLLLFLIFLCVLLFVLSEMTFPCQPLLLFTNVHPHHFQAFLIQNLSWKWPPSKYTQYFDFPRACFTFLPSITFSLPVKSHGEKVWGPKKKLSVPSIPTAVECKMAKYLLRGVLLRSHMVQHHFLYGQITGQSPTYHCFYLPAN